MKYDVTSKKWEWIERRKQYGYVSRITKKYVCKVLRGMSGPSSESITSECRKQDGVDTDIDNFNNLGTPSVDNGCAGSGMFESESY